ncbi:MAG TPA: hypothetical protein VN736_01055 [Candidatus Limnocylindrales bacterium]|nr:hypothetical protein [Candidatus Limnocylindrales bacterium]
MRKEVQALLHAAKSKLDRAEPHRANSSGSVSPVIVDSMMSVERWYTFRELGDKYGLSHDKVSRDFVGRDGVAKFGSDYRVSEAAVREWLSAALIKNKEKAA